MEKVKSSTISKMSYEKDTKTLTLEFRSGELYQFPNISEQQAKAFRSSKSKGKYFASRIQGKPFRRLVRISSYRRRDQNGRMVSVRAHCRPL